MPRSSDHKGQILHNQNLLHETIFEPKTSLYCDWVVTISFYVAVHLVDSVLASDHGHLDIITHDQRRGLVKDHLSSGAKNVFALFEILYSDTRRARYDCVTVTTQQASDALNLLAQIKKKLA